MAAYLIGSGGGVGRVLGRSDVLDTARPAPRLGGMPVHPLGLSYDRPKGLM